MKVAHGSLVCRDISMLCMRSNHHLKRLQGTRVTPCKVCIIILFLMVRIKTIYVVSETALEPPCRFIRIGTVNGAIVIVLVRCRKLHVVASLRQAIPYNHICYEEYL